MDGNKNWCGVCSASGLSTDVVVVLRWFAILVVLMRSALGSSRSVVSFCVIALGVCRSRLLRGNVCVPF